MKIIRKLYEHHIKIIEHHMDIVGIIKQLHENYMKFIGTSYGNLKKSCDNHRTYYDNATEIKGTSYDFIMIFL